MYAVSAHLQFLNAALTGTVDQRMRGKLLDVQAGIQLESAVEQSSMQKQ